MDNRLTIKCPDGYILNQEDYAKGIISFIKEKFPTSWIDFCKRFPIKMSEKYISYDSEILNVDKPKRNDIEDKNVFINQEEAEKFLTLIQLRRIWQEYHRLEEDKTAGLYLYKIIPTQDDISISYVIYEGGMFYFKTESFATMFLNNFKEQLEQIKELL